ncbi:MAG: hypothetical protein WAQ99_09390 [Pyrinomonadaceae bacterium]
MTCYDVDTTDIERMADALKELTIDLTEAEPEQFAGYARENQDLLSDLVAKYFDAVSCFFEVMRNIAWTALQADEAKHPAESNVEPAVVDRSYLREFLPLYDRASEEGLARLRRLLQEVFAEEPELRAAFVAEMVASGTVEESRIFCSTVATADSAAQAQEHGSSGKEVVDSVKQFLLSFLKEEIGWKRFIVRKKSIERILHIVNEILNMVFRGPQS